MKSVVLWAFLLGVESCVVYGDEPKCAAKPTDAKFTVKSYRGQTGHWDAQVQLEHSYVEGDGTAWELDIDHTYTPQCDGSGTVSIVGNIAAKPQPPKGYIKFSERHYFRPHSEAVIWEDARDICEKEGAHLAVINSEAEAKFIACNWNSSEDSAFIGTHDRYVEGKYVTIYNQALRDAGYDKWHAGEPDGGTAQNCGVIFLNRLLGNSYCNLPLPFFCEWEY